MNLLVAGGDQVDAGKTTFAGGLLAHLDGATEATPHGFKPRAANDYWFDHDDVLAALAEQRLYGKDARRLANAEGGDRQPETLNPLHRLWKPTPGRTGVLGAADRTFLLDRLRTAEGVEFILNADAEMPAPVREALALSEATEVESITEFNKLMTERYLPAFERLAAGVREPPVSVVESYGDIALPLEDVEFDAVAVVDPGRVQVFDGRRWLRSCAVASGSPQEGQLEERTDDVIELTDPITRVSLPALSQERQADPAAVAEAYAEAYVELLAVAG